MNRKYLSLIMPFVFLTLYPISSLAVAKKGEFKKHALRQVRKKIDTDRQRLKEDLKNRWQEAQSSGMSREAFLENVELPEVNRQIDRHKGILRKTLPHKIKDYECSQPAVESAPLVGINPERQTGSRGNR